MGLAGDALGMQRFRFSLLFRIVSVESYLGGSGSGGWGCPSCLGCLLWGEMSWGLFDALRSNSLFLLLCFVVFFYLSFPVKLDFAGPEPTMW